MRNSILVDEDKFCKAWGRFVALSNSSSELEVVAGNCCKLKQPGVAAEEVQAAGPCQQAVGAAKAGQEGARHSWQAAPAGEGGRQAAWPNHHQAAGAAEARQMPSSKGFEAEQGGWHCCLAGSLLMTGCLFMWEKILSIGFRTRWMAFRSKWNCPRK